MTLFQTERFIISRFTANDEESFFLLNSNEQSMQFIRQVKSREECDAFLIENINFYQDSSILGRYAVLEKDSGAFVGTFSYLYLSGDSDIHLGYALLPNAWGKGIATELVLEGLLYFFKHTNKQAVFAITNKENKASQNVLIKAGFTGKGEHMEGGQNLELFYFQSNWLMDKD